MSAIGKRLGKIVILELDYPPEDTPKRFKYKGKWYHIRCDCGNDRWVPQGGIAGYRSCGCARHDFNKVQANECVKYTPNQTKLHYVRDQVYQDL